MYCAPSLAQWAGGHQCPNFFFLLSQTRNSRKWKRGAAIPIHSVTQPASPPSPILQYLAFSFAFSFFLSRLPIFTSFSSPLPHFVHPTLSSFSSSSTPSILPPFLSSILPSILPLSILPFVRLYSRAWFFFVLSIVPSPTSQSVPLCVTHWTFLFFCLNDLNTPLRTFAQTRSYFSRLCFSVSCSLSSSHLLIRHLTLFLIMATYKQRPYSRHVGSGRHSPDIASPKITQTPVHHPVAHSSLAQTTPSQLQSQSHSHSHGLSHPDDDILDNASDHEWTSIRHTISARAKARQEQYYRNQEQQRAQEWHFVLGQHQKASASVSARNITRKIKDIHSSDEYEDPVASPVASISTHQQDQQTPIRFETDLEGESSHFGFSDLASDLDGDESEGQGWSHDDDEIASSSSTSIYGANTKHLDRHQQKSFSSPYSNASTTSLSNLAHPSFALGHNDNPGVGFHLQNKMPFHDGSGYFGAVLSGDSDQGGWESSTSDVSSIFSSYSRKIAKRHSLSPRTRPISSPEFGSVLQNMATLQGQLNHPHLHPYHHHYPHTHQSMMTKDKRSDSNMVSTVASASLYPSTRASKPHRQRFHGQIKLQNCSIYESEMEDIEGMVIDIPSRVGWLQIFEQALNVFNNNQDDLDSVSVTFLFYFLVKSSDPCLFGSWYTLLPAVFNGTHQTYLVPIGFFFCI